MLYTGISGTGGPQTATRAATEFAAEAARPSETMTAVAAEMVAQVSAMRTALLGSEKAQIEECTQRLEQAADAFRDAFQIPNLYTFPHRSRLNRDLAALRKDLSVVAGLAQSGEALYRGLARLLGAAAAGYTPQGDGAPLRPSVSVLVRG
jgi:hypothetical protein